MATNFTRLTPKYDEGKKQPKKKLVRKLLLKCKEYSSPVLKQINPEFATQYHPEFLKAFKRICLIYKESSFLSPEKQVLVLMLDNNIPPCRADEFNEKIVARLSGGAFDR